LFDLLWHHIDLYWFFTFILSTLAIAQNEIKATTTVAVPEACKPQVFSAQFYVLFYFFLGCKLKYIRGKVSLNIGKPNVVQVDFRC
jgi:hypothetical protein